MAGQPSKMSVPPKVSYTIPCGSAFREAVLRLAARRQVNAADLARAVLLTLPAAIVAGLPDPGEPDADDRETITLRSGASAGRLWRRKPRLQVRLPAGQDVVTIRKALGFALALHGGTLSLSPVRAGVAEEERRRLEDLEARMARQSEMIAALSFQPLPEGVRTRDEALFVLGYPPGARPDQATIGSRFRTLARIHHPDNETGDTVRMAQLNAAMGLLRKRP